MAFAKKPRPSCKAKAVDFLSRSDQSIRRLSDKLKQKEYTEEEIEETIGWLQDKHFLQEEEGCRRRFENLYHASSYSLRQIVAKLQQKGYEREMIEDCVPEDTDGREYEVAYKVASRKFKPGADKGKIYQHLCMKGFGYDIARNVVEDLLLEWEESE